eukprot:Skav219804  [mRNA]  locus=scaffold147:197334:197600:+ [translate_table: standard]
MTLIAPVPSGSNANLAERPGLESTKVSTSNSPVGHVDTTTTVTDVRHQAKAASALMMPSDTGPAGIKRHRTSVKTVSKTPVIKQYMPN